MTGAPDRGLRLRELGSFEAARALRDGWDALVRRSAATMTGVDVTATFEWMQVIWETRDIEGDLRILAAEADDAVVAVLPTYMVHERRFGIPRHRLHLVSNMYGGRCGFLLAGAGQERFDRVMDDALRGPARWDDFLLSVLDGSESERLLREYAKSRGHGLVPVSRTVSPYIRLPGPGTDPLAGLGKKLRYNIRNSEKKLRDAGVLEFRLVSQGADPEEFLRLVMDVERRSWKHEAGTAITRNPRQERFYRAFAVAAARAGWLHAAVLLLSGEPVAHVYGVLYEGIYYDLKESYDARFSTIAPGHVLKRYLLADLVERGVPLFDYMGRCEPYKMQWTDLTYSQTTYVMYNHTPLGRLLALKNSLSRGTVTDAGSRDEDFER